MMPAKMSAMNMPFSPPKARPATMSRSVITVRSRVVLKMLLMEVASGILVIGCEEGPFDADGESDWTVFTMEYCIPPSFDLLESIN